MEETMQTSANEAAAQPEAEALEVAIEQPSAVSRKINVTVPESRIKNQYEKAMATLVREAAVPGFRKGRAPRRLLEKRFKADVQNDVRAQLLSDSISEAMENNSLHPLTEPKFIPSLPELPENGALKFAVEFEVLPEFSLPDLSGVELKKPTLTVTDERMNLAKEHLRGNLAEMREVPEAGDPDDHIDADIHILDQSGAMVEKFEHRHVHFTPEFTIDGIGIEGFDGHLRGAKAGSSVRIEVTLPPDFKREDLRGQKATVELHLTKIMRRVKPELTDDMAKANGFDDLNDLNNSLQRAIEERLKTEVARLLREQAAEKLRGIVQIEVPPSLLNNAMAQLAQRVMQEAAQAGRDSQLSGDIVERIRAVALPQAQIEVIAMRLAERFGVDVHDAEVNAEVSTMAEMNGMRPEVLLNQMRRGRQFDALRTELLKRKVLDRVVEQCKVVEVDEAHWKAEQDATLAAAAGKTEQPAITAEQPPAA